MLILSNFGSFF